MRAIGTSPAPTWRLSRTAMARRPTHVASSATGALQRPPHRTSEPPSQPTRLECDRAAVQQRWSKADVFRPVRVPAMWPGPARVRLVRMSAPAAMPWVHRPPHPVSWPTVEPLPPSRQRCHRRIVPRTRHRPCSRGTLLVTRLLVNRSFSWRLGRCCSRRRGVGVKVERPQRSEDVRP
jgi:hypothetical protein